MAPLRPRPEPSPKPAARASVAAAAALLCAPFVFAAPAAAQVGLGAERYEVTITPPKRPGSEAASPETAPADAAAEKSADQAPASPGSPPPDDDNYQLGASGKATTAAPSSAPAPAHAEAPAAPAAARPATTGPLHTLQVGAYRQRGSASALAAKLGPSFTDVDIVEVQSGGQPLYRVNVGRLPRGSALDDLKKRLVAAGYPAFEVAAPPVSAGD